MLASIRVDPSRVTRLGFLSSSRLSLISCCSLMLLAFHPRSSLVSSSSLLLYSFSLLLLARRLLHIPTYCTKRALWQTTLLQQAYVLGPNVSGPPGLPIEWPVNTPFSCFTTATHVSRAEREVVRFYDSHARQLSRTEVERAAAA